MRAVHRVNQPALTIAPRKEPFDFAGPIQDDIDFLRGAGRGNVIDEEKLLTVGADVVKMDARKEVSFEKHAGGTCRKRVAALDGEHQDFIHVNIVKCMTVW